jgi:ABC-2 type transport system permease protein
MNLNDELIAPFFGTMWILLIFGIPAVTMGLFAAEKTNRTEELLLTSPVTIWDIVLGKYLAAAVFVTLLVVLVAFYPGLLFVYGDPEPEMTAAGLLALLLASLSYAAVGAFASSITSNQIIAFFVGLVILLVFLILSVVAELGSAQGLFAGGSWAADLMRWLATADHFQRLAEGLVETRDLVYFAVMTGTFLLLAKAALESVRWR